MPIGDGREPGLVSQPRLGGLHQIDPLQRAVNEEAGMTIVLGGERRVVVDSMEEPRRGAEHEQVQGRRVADLNWRLGANGRQGAHR